MAQLVEAFEENDDQGPETTSNGRAVQDDGGEADEDDDEDDEDDEPRLNYASLTKNLRHLYRNGDATSAFVVGGDKMVRACDLYYKVRLILKLFSDRWDP